MRAAQEQLVSDAMDAWFVARASMPTSAKFIFGQIDAYLCIVKHGLGC